MTISAIVPVAHMKAANDALELAGFGPRNFSVPCYGGTGATHGALHAWDDPAFLAELLATPDVIVAGEVVDTVFVPAEGDPATVTKALIEAQGARWGEQSPPLPSTGNVTAGSLYRFEDALWSVIQTFSRTTYGAHPSTYPALIRRVRDPHKVEPWQQPLDQYDSYKLVNAFTGNPDECTENGTRYATKIDNNVWSPSGYPAGWQAKP